MAFFIDELLTYLDSQLAVSWVIGTNLFWNSIPEDATTALCIYEEPGEGANLVADVFTPFISLKSRANGDNAMATARANFDSAFQVFNRLAGVNLTTYNISFIESIGSGPRVLRDDPRDIILEGNFRVKYKTGLEPA